MAWVSQIDTSVCVNFRRDDGRQLLREALAGALVSRPVTEHTGSQESLRSDTLERGGLNLELNGSGTGNRTPI